MFARSECRDVCRAWVGLRMFVLPRGLVVRMGGTGVVASCCTEAFAPTFTDGFSFRNKFARFRARFTSKRYTPHFV